jgi:nucleoside-diphosphate-sugar epimerase
VSDRRRVLVTGGSGFIGRHTLANLLQRGYEVQALGRHALLAAPDGVVSHIADLADDAAVLRVMRAVRPTHLLHLAWDVTHGVFWSSPANLDWVAFSLRLYRAFAAQGGRRAVFAGTCAEYDWGGPVLDEARTKLRPATLYGAAKCALHDLVARSAEADAVSVAWGRLFMLYGPHEHTARLVSYVARTLLDGQPALCGDGMAARDFMHAADAALALVTLLDSDVQGGVNIASGRCVPMREVIGIIGNLTGRPGLVRLGARPAPANEPPRLEATVSLLHGSLGFTPRFTLETGLADAVGWWRNAQLPTNAEPK